MRTLVYDILRVLRNRGVLLIVLATVLMALTATLLFASLSRPENAMEANLDLTDVAFIMGIIFSFFVPLVGIQAGYSTYARDRSTGILESVLVRPVTRTQIIVSRYVAVLVASAVAIAMALLVLDAMAEVATGYFIPAVEVGGLFIGLWVEAVAFGGILFLIAHLVRSPGAVMGSSVVIFVVVDIVWFFLLIFVGLLLGGIDTLHGIQDIVHLEYTDPAGFVFLMMSDTQGGPFGGFIQLPLGELGIYPWALALTAIAWVLLPFLAALWLARHRD